MSSNSGVSGNGGLIRSSRKQKPKKIPQRGLGVAQLEKIRIGEQQKREAANSILNYPTPTLTPAKCSTIAAPNFVNYPSNQLSSSCSAPYSPPPLPPSPTTLSSSHSNGDYNPILRPPSLIPSIEGFHLNSVRFDVGWPSIPPPIHGNAQFSKMWNPYDMNHDVESNPRFDQQGPVSGLNVSLPQENSPVGSLPDIMSRVQHFQQSSASSLMNIPLMNSPPIFDFQMEPPSNQSYFSNFSSFWPDEGKMVYIKRPYPFPLECSAIPSLLSKLPRVVHPMDTSDESTSCGNGSSNNLDPSVPIFSARAPERITKKSNNRENGNLNGNFLSLAPPSVTPLPPSPRYHPNGIGQDLGVNKLGTGQGGPNQQQPFFGFVPSAKHQHWFPGANNYGNSNNNGDLGDSVDLSLKL